MGIMWTTAVTARQVSLFKKEEFMLVIRENFKSTRSISCTKKYYCTLSEAYAYIGFSLKKRGGNIACQMSS